MATSDLILRFLLYVLFKWMSELQYLKKKLFLLTMATSDLILRFLLYVLFKWMSELQYLKKKIISFDHGYIRFNFEISAVCIV